MKNCLTKKKRLLKLKALTMKRISKCCDLYERAGQPTPDNSNAYIGAIQEKQQVYFHQFDRINKLLDNLNQVK